jgi:hypothetical protein
VTVCNLFRVRSAASTPGGSDDLGWRAHADGCPDSAVVMDDPLFAFHAMRFARNTEISRRLASLRN